MYPAVLKTSVSKVRNLKHAKLSLDDLRVSVVSAVVFCRLFKCKEVQFLRQKMDRDEVSESLRNLSNSAETFGAISHSAPTNQQLDLLGSEQIFQRRLVGNHVEASPERFELLLHALVQHVICVLSDKLLHANGWWRLTEKFVHHLQQR